MPLTDLQKEVMQLALEMFIRGEKRTIATLKKAQSQGLMVAHVLPQANARLQIASDLLEEFRT